MTDKPQAAGDPLYGEARALTHHWIGSEEFVHLDVTDRVAKALAEARDQWGAGDKSKWHDHGTVLIHGTEHRLIYGEHPHSRSDNRHYVDMGGKELVGFDGNRILVDVVARSSNYLKSSYYSGDQVRKGGTCAIFFNNIQVYEFFFREIAWALRRANHLISTITEHSLRYWDPEEAKKLVGRPIFYRDIPAFITRVIVDQGCIMVARRDGEFWPPAIYEENPENSDREKEVKLDIIEPTTNIWYFDNSKAYVFGGLSESGAGVGGLPRSEVIHGPMLPGAEAQRGSWGGSGEDREGVEGQRGKFIRGGTGSPGLRAGGRPVVPRGPVEGARLEPRSGSADEPGETG